MKKVFYIIGMVLFAVCVFASCQTSTLNKVKKNLSEESQVVFSGKTEIFYITLTSGRREEPYKIDGISNKKVDFSLVSITFFYHVQHQTFEFEISINNEKQTFIAEKSPLTNNYMFDIETQTKPTDNIVFKAHNQETELTCKSTDFIVNYQTAIEKGTEYLMDKLELIQNKKGRFEVFLKLATAPNNYDDVFVWYYLLQSDIGIGSMVIINCMDPNIYHKL